MQCTFFFFSSYFAVHQGIPCVARLAVAELAFGLGLSGSGQLGFQLPGCAIHQHGMGYGMVIPSEMDVRIKFIESTWHIITEHMG